ncbi:MAG: LamG-like jellyroll fold domain-containing protein [Verrucomicrobiota bacterium]|nr:LamG-like jellyroll fold domain-containing protein [Verrucomicrobiota bacterium]
MKSPISTLAIICIVSLFNFGTPKTAHSANYQATVIKLKPTYYYELNETDTESGVMDTMGNAPKPGTYNGDYGFGGPEVGGPGAITVFSADDFDGIPVPGLGGEDNLAHYSNNSGHIILGDGNLYGSSSITVALFFKAGPAQGGDRLFTNNLSDPTKSFQVNVANDGMVLAVDPSQTGFNAERTLFMEDNSGPDRRLIKSESGWFHVVASTYGSSGPERAANFKLWINGVDRTENLQPNVTGWGIDTGLAKIGGRKADPAHSTTHSGAQDEVAIWLDRVLTDDEARSLWEAAITEKKIPLLIQDVELHRGKTTNAVTVTWNSRRGRVYGVYSTTNLQNDEWEELDDGIESEGESTSFRDEGIPLTDQKRFYKVMELE